MPNTIKLYKTFIEDILSHGDNAFAKRVLGHIYNEFEGTSNNSNDHRYHGIDNAWIRYLSRGSTAYRIIYIRDGSESVFYRCGNHSVEDNLSSPSSSNEIISLEITENELQEMTRPTTLLTNHQTPIMLTAFLGRNMIPHREVYIVSPFIDPTLLFRSSKIGRLLDNMTEDGAEVRIVTALHSLEKFEKQWKDLESRGIELVFMPDLHSKIYLFLTNHNHHHRLAKSSSLGIVGSSNLTKRGIPENLGLGNHETNYTVSDTSIDELHNIALEHFLSGDDYKRAKHKSRKK